MNADEPFAAFSGLAQGMEADERLDAMIDWSRVPGGDATERAERLKALTEHMRTRRTPRFLFDCTDRADARGLCELLDPSFSSTTVALGRSTMLEECPVDEWPGIELWLPKLTHAFVVSEDVDFVRAGLDRLRMWAAHSRQCREMLTNRQRFNGLPNANCVSVLSDFFAATRDAPVWAVSDMVMVLDLLWRVVRSLEDAQKLCFHNITLVQLVYQHAFAVCFPEFTVSDTLQQSTLAEIEECSRQCVRPDGSSVEQSPHYHFYVMKHLALNVLLRRRNGLTDAAHATSNTLAMAWFLHGMRTPNGGVPPFSDCHDGGDAAHGRTDRVSANLIPASLCLDDACFPSAHPAAAQCMLFPPEQIRACLERSALPEREKDQAFSDAGYYVMRSSLNDEATYLAFDAGPTGYYHGHLDLFTIHLMVGGRSLLPEPGSFSYTPTLSRIGSMGTPFHNTVSLDNYSHRSYEDEYAQLAHVTQWEPAVDGSVCVSAHHTAYDHLWGQPTVYRQIYFNGQGLFVIVDRLHCADVGVSKRPHAFMSNFTLPDGDRFMYDAPQASVMTTFENGPNLSIRCLSSASLHGKSVVHAERWRVREVFETKRWCVVQNVDRGWHAFVLAVGEGPAVPVPGMAEGEANGEIRVHAEWNGQTYDLSCFPNHISRNG